jgi:DNA sulfur modification protein DndD
VIVNSISLKNFQCYHGELEDNRFDFKNGLNIVIGDNGAGKSKLFDAFWWVIYDQVFVSDSRTFEKTSAYGEKLVNDKAKMLIDEGEVAETEVCLIVTSYTSNKVFRLTRKLTVMKDGLNSWKDKGSKLFIEEKVVNRWRPTEPSKAAHYLNMVIPSHIKPYMWFQGEQVDSLMDLTDKAALNNIIRLLSDINVYDELIKISTKGADKAEKDLQSEKKKNSKNEKESNELEKRFDGLKHKITELKQEIERAESEKEISENKLSELMSKIENATQSRDIENRRKNVQNKIEGLQTQINNKYNLINKFILSDSWVLKDTQNTFDQFKQNYDVYYKQHQLTVLEATSSSIKLPINIPRPVQIQQMLDEEKCFVCDREAGVGSAAYKHIHSLNKREPDKKLDEIFKTDCSSFFENLYSDLLKSKGTHATIDSRIQENLQELNQLKSDLQDCRDELAAIERDFGDMLDSETSEQIVREFRTHDDRKDHWANAISNYKHDLATKEKLFLDVKSRLDSLVTGAINSFFYESERVYSDIKTVCEETRKNVFQNIIASLEKKANEIFAKLTFKNDAVVGKIKLKKVGEGINQQYFPEIVNSHGHIISSPNDSNIILVKLSLIMAIITYKSKWSENYSLISDAPTSKMAENYTIGFYQTLSETFTQSIVTTFDFVDSSTLNKISKCNLGNIYRLKTSFPKGDRNDRTDLVVDITKVEL